MENKDLLTLLEKDARMSHTDLAMALQESEENVASAIKKLEEDKVICGYHTLINWDASNHSTVQALIQVTCSPERDFGYDRIAKRIYQFSEVDSMYLLSGSGAEFVVNVYGKTMQEVAHFVGSKLAPIEGVTGTATLFVLKQYKKNGIVLEEDKDKEDERLLVTP